jgi:hypothetical protein
MHRVSLTAALVAACFLPPCALAQAPQASKAVQSAQSAATAEQKLQRLTPAERAQFEASAKALNLDAKALAAQDAASAGKTLEQKKTSFSSASASAPGPTTSGIAKELVSKEEADISRRLAEERAKLAALDSELAKLKKDDREMRPKSEQRERAKKIVLDLEAKLAVARKGKDLPVEAKAGGKDAKTAGKDPKQDEREMQERIRQQQEAFDRVQEIVKKMNETRDAATKGIAGK